jgi:hypothetical protein
MESSNEKAPGLCIPGAFLLHLEVLLDTNRESSSFDLMGFHKGILRWFSSDQFRGQRFRLDVLAPIAKDLRQLISSCIPYSDAIFDVEGCILALCLDMTDDFACQAFGFLLGT